MIRIMPAIPVVCLVVLSSLQTHAATINVPANYATIQAAINAASNGDTVVIASGTYVENIDFKGKAITVTSTNPEDPTVVAATIIDGGGSGSVVSFRTGEGSGSLIEGFTIRNGNANNGAGIHCESASPTIRDCTVSGNAGSGVYFLYGAPRIRNCTISANKSLALPASSAHPRSITAPSAGIGATQ